MLASTGPIRTGPIRQTGQYNQQYDQQYINAQNQAQQQAMQRQAAAYQQQLQQMMQAIAAAQGGGWGQAQGGGQQMPTGSQYSISGGGRRPLGQGGQQGGQGGGLDPNAILQSLGIGSFQDLISQAQTAMGADQADALKAYKDQVVNLMGTGSASTEAIGSFMRGQEGQRASNTLGLFGQTFSPAAGYAGQQLQGQQGIQSQILGGMMGTVPPVSDFYKMNLPGAGYYSGASQGYSGGGGGESYQNPFTGNAPGGYNNPIGGFMGGSASFNPQQRANQWQGNLNRIGMRGRSYV